uniref:Uncharacterized protein n=1 Tax=Oryza brachyantha TaxID=4533 RepID=J3N9H8_ORYBR
TITTSSCSLSLSSSSSSSSPFSLISSQLEFANRIQKQQVRREKKTRERKKNKAFSLLLPICGARRRPEEE